MSLLAGWLYALSFPVFLLKQVISLLHLVRAAQRVVELDEADEEAAAAAAGSGSGGGQKAPRPRSASRSRKSA